MQPITRCLWLTLISVLCSSFTAAQDNAPTDSPSNSAGTDILQTSAIPTTDYDPVAVSEVVNWTQRAPADFVGGELGVIGLVRQKPNSQVIAFNSTNVLLNADELQGDMQFGLLAKIDVYQVSSRLGGTDLNLGYWGINSMDATRTINDPAFRPLFFQGTTTTPIQTYNYIYSSNLYSGEANLRTFNTRRIRPLIGMRYLKLEDTFDQFEFVSNGTTGYSSLTNNSLFGAQLGVEATLLRYRSWDWFATGKYGAMHNRVEGSAVAALAGGPATRNYSGSSYSSLVDCQTGLAFRFVDWLHLRSAYQALYCSDIATGVDQSGAIAFVGPPDDVVFDSRFWQGVSFTATVSF